MGSAFANRAGRAIDGADLLKKKLQRENRAEDALRLATLLRKLNGLCSLNKEWATLFLLTGVRLLPSPLRCSLQYSLAVQNTEPL